MLAIAIQATQKGSASWLRVISSVEIIPGHTFNGQYNTYRTKKTLGDRPFENVEPTPSRN